MPNHNKYRIAVTSVVVLILVAIIFGLIVWWQKKIVPRPVVEVPQGTMEIIGRSVDGRVIEAFRYGQGLEKIIFVGGIHGGYEWNSSLLAYKFIDSLKRSIIIVPQNITVIIIPTLNPDGLFAVTGKEGAFSQFDVKTDLPNGTGRFNSRKVDLNRNFDCRWQATSTWRSQIVSAGNLAFSEPETSALRDFLLKEKPVGVIFWHSQSNAVYASECDQGILPATKTLMNLYAQAAGYPAVDSFDSYQVTGDAEGWLASIGTPAITVELKTHETIEWDKNLAGFTAVTNYFDATRK